MYATTMSIFRVETRPHRLIEGSALYPLDSEDQEVDVPFSSRAVFFLVHDSTSYLENPKKI